MVTQFIQGKFEEVRRDVWLTKFGSPNIADSQGVSRAREGVASGRETNVKDDQEALRDHLRGGLSMHTVMTV
jgi:hypothetical protein